MVKKSLFLIILIFIILLFINSISFCQVEDELEFIVKNNPIETEVKEKIDKLSFKEVSEIKLAFMTLMRLYQLFISSQDKGSCNFTFSCSRFGMSAIQKFGVLHGFLITSDRLQRCNSLGRMYYHTDPKTGLAIDYPIDNYYLGKTKK